MTVKLVASDLDGTLMSRHNEVSPRTAAVIRELTSAGVELVLVTGRPLRWLWAGASALGHNGLAVAANGAIIADCARTTVIERHTLGSRDFAAVRALILKKWPSFSFALELDDELAIETTFPSEPLVSTTARYLDPHLPAPWPTDICKVFCTTGGALVGDAREQLSRFLEGKMAVYEINPEIPILEIRHIGVNKANAIKRICEQKGIDRTEIVAIGDAPSDADMLAWAGLGIAMGDGHPTALAAADVIASNFDEDGAASAIEDLINR